MNNNRTVFVESWLYSLYPFLKMEINASTKTASHQHIKSPTHFKSRIPQRVEEPKHEIKSPTPEKRQSKIPVSTSIKYSSSFNRETEVFVQRRRSEPSDKMTQEEKYGLHSKIPRDAEIKNKKLECLGIEVGEDESGDDNNYQFQYAEGSVRGYETISNENNYGHVEKYSSSVTTLGSVAADVDSKVHNNTSSNSWSSSNTSTTEKASDELDLTVANNNSLDSGLSSDISTAKEVPSDLDWKVAHTRWSSNDFSITKEVPTELDPKLANNKSLDSLLLNEARKVSTKVESTIATNNSTPSKEVPTEQIPTNLDSWSSNDTRSTNETNSENNKYIIVQPVYHEIHQQLSLNNALTSTPTSKNSSLFSEISTDVNDTDIKLEQHIPNSTMENELPTKPKLDRTSTDSSPETPSDHNKKHGFSSPEDFEKTEHDNNDYSTVTTTEYEKDGKMVRTTETLNYTNDRNIKTRVTTTEKIVTIPYGQQLDLNNPEITSSTTVRSKYLQTMLQNREYEGDKEIKAETLETIETDVQTDKVDSNDNTSDPDLDTVLVIVETLDEVRKTEPKIKDFLGTSVDDPIYTELLDILNKSLHKFEKIEPKGKESVEQKRQKGIEYIQRLTLQLNTKLQENQPKQPEANVANNAEQITQVASHKLQQNAVPVPVPDNNNAANAQKPVEKEEPEVNNTKKERKRSTLKKHFKLGNKDKKNGEEKEKKKKKKLCVIS